MFFVLSKLGWVLLTPSNVLSLAVLFGLLWAAVDVRRGRNAKDGLVVCGVAALMTLALAVTPLGRLPLQAMETRFPVLQISELPDDLSGAIVLGGALSLRRSALTGRPQWSDAADRITALLELRAARPDLPIVFTGGSGALTPGDDAEATRVRSFLDDIGLATSDMLFESRSRNTAENAAFTRDLLETRGRSTAGTWLLVTSGFHMPRSVGVFRKAGFAVLPFPVDQRLPVGGTGLTSVSQGLFLLDLGVREWIGLLAYRLAGYSDALWPDSSSSAGRASR